MRMPKIEAWRSRRKPATKIAMLCVGILAMLFLLGMGIRSISYGVSYWQEAQAGNWPEMTMQQISKLVLQRYIIGGIMCAFSIIGTLISIKHIRKTILSIMRETPVVVSVSEIRTEQRCKRPELHNIHGGVCSWCGKTTAELLKISPAPEIPKPQIADDGKKFEEVKDASKEESNAGQL